MIQLGAKAGPHKQVISHVTASNELCLCYHQCTHLSFSQIPNFKFVEILQNAALTTISVAKRSFNIMKRSSFEKQS